jgi:hypothetical protein
VCRAYELLHKRQTYVAMKRHYVLVSLLDRNTHF